MTERTKVNSLCCLYFVAKHFADIHFVLLAGELLQCGECAASVTESLHGVAQPLEFIEGCLKLRICHLVLLALSGASPDVLQIMAELMDRRSPDLIADCPS